MDNKEDTIHQGVSVDVTENPKDGISMKEIEEENPQNIRHEIGDDGAMRFASKARKMAADLANLQVKRLYKVKSNGNVAFFYSLAGNLEGATVDTLNSIKDVLKSIFEGDYEICFMPSEPTMVKSLTARVDTKRNLIYIYYEMKFNRPWEPPKNFEEVK